MSEYTYTDRDGDRLTIEPCGERAATACLTTTSGAHLPAADLPKIVAKLYEAAGQPNPLAERPGQHVMQDVLDRRDLVIEPSIRAESAVYFGQSSARGWHIRAEDLPELVGALYEAAGKPAPIILDRPDEEDLRGGGWLDGKHVSATEHELGTITPHAARAFAACLAGAADLADAEPDPEQVEDVVELIYQSGAIDGSEWAAARAAKIARAILAAGYARTEGKV